MTSFDAEAYLNSLHPLGWRFGLERMHRLTSVLGMPQHRFASIHVVGTNGKSSVAQMIAALLEAHGVSAGACLSPHLVRWSERVRIRGLQIEPGAFGAAVERTAQGAEVANRALEEGDAVTQFEAATAAAFVALAAAGVSAGVIEAGLGGRLDATNVIPSRVTVLTSVGLDHTEWLGETEAEIAGEKLAVLRDHSVLVTGALSDEVDALAAEIARQRGALHVRAPLDPGPQIALRAPGAFQRRNFALAAAAAEAFLGSLEPEAVREVAASVTIPGRLEVVAHDPATILDVAHNPDGAAALAEALPGVTGGKPVFACVAILADKDAEAMLRALAPALEYVVCTELPADRLRASGRPGARSRPAAELAEICSRLHLAAEIVAEPEAALTRARELAAARDGVALAAGSHYLLGAAWTRRHAQSFSR
ncbi:MAG TPA: cyanophycin synthetase [Solirubrobacterales bacterium]